jgi:hypothetical protein
MNTACTGVIKLQPLANFLKQYKEGSVVEHIEQGNFEKKRINKNSRGFLFFYGSSSSLSRSSTVK